jgi:hypothetical protein
MTRWLFPLLAVLLQTGCTTTYTYIDDIGGEMSLRLEPVAGDGVTVDLTEPGMTRAEHRRAIESSSYPNCASPRLSWALDSGTDEPLFGMLEFCARDAAVGGADGAPAKVVFELDGSSGFAYLDIESTVDETPIPRVTVLETIELDGELEPSGSWSGEVLLSGDWVDGDVPHLLTLEWDFPIHVEETDRVRNSGGPIGDV